MIIIKTPDELDKMREGGKNLAYIVSEVAKACKPGVTTNDLNELTAQLIKEKGDSSAILNYTPYGAKRPFPAVSCISINDEIVHGIPNEDPKTLVEGDIVGIDIAIVHKGLIVDHATTVPVGNISHEAKKLLSVTREALQAGIKEARVGNRIGDIGAAIQKHAEKNKYSVVQGLCGHGVGREIHEDPYVPNEGRRGDGDLLVAGMTIAIEPMFAIGTGKIKTASDGYTYLTKDGSLSAQFEHTVAITERGPEILTKIK